MNKRIEKLALRAGEYVNSVYTPPIRSKTPDKIWEDGHVDWHTQFNQKFAELIVGECYETIKKDMELAHIQLIPIDFGIYANGRLRRIIKEHFGVEQ
jgi:hypothetical protein